MKASCIQIIAIFIVQSLTSICFGQNFTIKPDTIFLKFKQQLQEAEKENNKFKIAQANESLGDYYHSILNQSKALEKYFIAKDLYEQNNNKEKSAYNLKRIGWVFLTLEDTSAAITYYRASLNIFKALKMPWQVAMMVGNIGHIYGAFKQWTKAKIFHLEALRVYDSLKDKEAVAAQLINVSSCFSGEKNYQAALEAYDQAIKIYDSIGNKQQKAVCFEHMAEYMFMPQKKYRQAIDYTFNSLNNADSNRGIISYDYELLGAIYLELSEDANLKSQRKTNLDSAEFYLFKCLEIQEKSGRIGGLRNTYSSLALLKELQGDYFNALKFSKLWQKLSDSINSNKQYFDIVRNQINADFEKKEIVANAEIAKQKFIRNSFVAGSVFVLLSAALIFYFYKRKKSAEQKQKETSLSLQVSETEMKALRSQMNPHFIFNALQSIQTFLLSHKSEEANLYLLKFAKLMRLVLENSQHSEVSLKEDMQALELYMQLESIRLPHPFTYRFHIDKSVDEENDTIPPLILQPFVENAIWHGLQYKPGPGHIDIYICKNDNELCATVEDNGVGRDMSRQVAQPMLLKKESLGMKLTEERLKVLNEVKKTKSEFKITDLFTPEYYPAGTKVELSLPFETL